MGFILETVFNSLTQNTGIFRIVNRYQGHKYQRKSFFQTINMDQSFLFYFRFLVKPRM